MECSLTSVSRRGFQKSIRFDHCDELLLGQGCSVGADKGNDRGSFVSELDKRKVKPPIAQNSKKGDAAQCRAKVARTKGYAKSQEVRKRIGSIFGWVKVIGGLRTRAPVCRR